MNKFELNGLEIIEIEGEELFIVESEINNFDFEEEAPLHIDLYEEVLNS